MGCSHHKLTAPILTAMLLLTSAFALAEQGIDCRVENGRIAEHGDVMETIADEATWQNQNGKF